MSRSPERESLTGDFPPQIGESRAWRSGLELVVLEGIRDSLELAVHFELAEDGLYVAAHRARTHAELPGDVFGVLAA